MTILRKSLCHLFIQCSVFDVGRSSVYPKMPLSYSLLSSNLRAKALDYIGFSFRPLTSDHDLALLPSVL